MYCKTELLLPPSYSRKPNPLVVEGAYRLEIISALQPKSLAYETTTTLD